MNIRADSALHEARAGRVPVSWLRLVPGRPFAPPAPCRRPARFHFATELARTGVAVAGRMLAAGGHLVRAALHAIGYLCIVSTMAMRRGCDARAPVPCWAWDPASGGGSCHE